MSVGAVTAASPETVTIQFKGGALPMFGRTLLAAICMLLIVPAAWGIVPFVRWFVSQLAWSDGAEARFEGEPGEVWHLFALAGLIGYLPIVAQYAIDDSFMVRLGAAIVTAVLSAIVAVPIWRWYTSRTRIGQIADLTFDGSVTGYMGFTVLMQLAVYTIIGWAWVSTAMQRWLFSHVRSNEASFEFLGSGLSLLWRGFAVGLASIFIIPIPWVIRWLIVWYVEQTVMHRTAPAQSPFFSQE